MFFLMFLLVVNKQHPKLKKKIRLNLIENIIKLVSAHEAGYHS